MPQSAIGVYLDALPALQAEWCLLLSQAVSLPYMPSRVAREMLERWRRAIDGGQSSPRSTPPVLLQLIGIGIEHAHSNR